MKFKYLVPATFIILIMLPSYAAEPLLSFSYAFLIKTPGGKVIPVHDTGECATIDPCARLKIYVKPEQNVFIYLFLHDAEDNLHLIFPRYFSGFDESTYSMGKAAYIPGGLHWFPFTGSGEERFYLIASTKQLADLEKVFTDYEHLVKKNKDDAVVKDARQQVIAQMKKQRFDHFALVQKVKPGIRLVAGEFRDSGEIKEFTAVTINNTQFYSRIIRIIH